MSLAGGHEGFREFLSDLLPYQKAMLFHLLACQPCKEQVVQKLMDEEGLSLLLPEPDEWCEEATRETEALPAGTEQEMAELLSRPPGQRSGLLAEDRFHKASLVEALLLTSRLRQLDNPELSEHLASLARQLAPRVPEIRDGGRMPAFLTRAAVLIANARRLAGNLAEAERAFADCLFYSAPPLEQALFQRALGLIRWEQGRLDEARSLLDQACRLFAGAQLLREEGATLILLGILETEQGDRAKAMASLLSGLCVVTPEDRPWLLIRGVLSLAKVFDREGGGKLAAELLEAARRLYPRIEDPAESVRISRLETGEPPVGPLPFA